MWNTPSPAPEYRLGWGDKALVRQCMMRILEWDFERVILSHGDLIIRDAKRLIAHAWRKILGRALPSTRTGGGMAALAAPEMAHGGEQRHNTFFGRGSCVEEHESPTFAH